MDGPAGRHERHGLACADTRPVMYATRHFTRRGFGTHAAETRRVAERNF